MAPNKSLLLIFMVIASSVCQDTLSVDYIQNKRQIATLGMSISSVLRKTVNQFLVVKIITFEEEKEERFRDEIDEIMRIAQGQLVFEVSQYNMFEREFDPNKICPGICLLLFDSLSNYNEVVFRYKISEKILNRNYELNLIIRFIRNALPQQVLDLANEHQRYDSSYHVEIPNVFTLVNGNRSFIDLFEINNFVGDNRKGKCDQLAMSIINRFSKEKLEWEGELKQLKKRNKFNGCVIEYDSSSDEGVYIKRIRNKQNNHIHEQTHFSGYLAETVKELTNISNFNLFFFDRGSSSDKEDELFESHYANNTSQYERPQLIKLYSMHRRKKQQRAPLIYKELYFVIPKGELYSEWEKLLFAFDFITWCMIAATFVAAFGTIIIINHFAPRQVRNFVFGRNVTMPSLNILIAFFGLSQGVVPRRNFARFLLILFIMWSLIFRTCYQGLLFEHLQGDGRKPAVASIKELLDRNFTYFIHAHHCIHLYGMELNET